MFKREIAVILLTMNFKVRALMSTLVLGVAFSSLAAPSTAATSEREHDRIVSYWTKANMDSARTLDFEFSPGSRVANRVTNPQPANSVVPASAISPNATAICSSATAISNATGISWNDCGAALEATGKVFFNIGLSRYVCSGAVVTESDSNRSVVLTAGHCIWDNASQAFVTNWLFIPEYDTVPTSTCASTQRGCWTATALVAHSGFTSQRSFTTQATQYDWGFAVVGNGGNSGTQLDATVGSFPISFDGFTNGSQAYAFGYPAAAPYNGSDLTYCSGALSQDPNSGNTTWAQPSCAMTGGSSGGPWMSSFATDRGSLSSLNSYGYTNSVGMYGPKFNSNTVDTFNAALTANANTVVAPVGAPVAGVSITGTQQVASTLTADTASSVGSNLTFTYRWQRATTLNGNYSNITGATARTYLLTATDANRFIRVVVVATNTLGTSTATSTPTSAIAAAPPIAPVAVAAITGTARVGSRLTASTTGTTGSPQPTFTYQWQSAATANGIFTNISNQTAATFVPTNNEASKFIKVSVTATNSAGSNTAVSAASSVVTQVPNGTVSVTGVTTVGQSLQVVTTNVLGFPAPTFTYQWQRSTSATSNTYTNINSTVAAPSRNASYTLVAADRNRKVRVVVVARNTAGQASITSPATANIQ